ncbi:MAG: hypothetical protein AAF789_10545 [Bacteroidota bacterium]
MRLDRLIWLLVALASCKATVKTTAATYEEDLSVHRPPLNYEETEPQQEEQKEIFEKFTPLTGSIKDELDSIMKISAQWNKKNNVVNGYVIQIYSGISREEANNVHEQAYLLYPELQPKIIYRQPNFRVRLGRFTERLRATRIYTNVKKDFDQALLVPDRFRISYD